MHGIIFVPMESIWYRAYRKGDATQKTDPIFFGDMEVAWLNAQQPGRTLGEFCCLAPLRLLDMRYVMAILPFMFKNTDTSSLEMLSRSLGLCSFRRQIELLEKLQQLQTTSSTLYPDLLLAIQRMTTFEQLAKKPIWVNPIELRGVRVGIADQDFRVMLWLRDLFGKVADGIIAPALSTPFHTQGSTDIEQSIMYQELIIFNPKRTLQHVRDLPISPKMIYYHLTVPLDKAYLDQNYKEFVPGHRMTKMTGIIGMTGGGVERRPFNKDELSPDLATVVKKERKAWLPHIRRIQRSQEFLQQTYVTFKALQPPRNLPSGDVKM